MFVRILEKLKEIKYQYYKDKPCPTPILLYIAARWRYHADVMPWYERIKELTGYVDKNNMQFHSAVICGMYPELKEASIQFANRATEFIQKNKEQGIVFHDKDSRSQLVSGLKKIENEIIAEFGLQKSYEIMNLSDTQKKSIAINLKIEKEKYNDEILSDCVPVVQALARIAYEKIGTEGEFPLAFGKTMGFLNIVLRMGPDKNIKPKQDDGTYAFERHEIANQIFEMQKAGIIDDKFNIVDMKAFNSSKLLRKFPYHARIYDISTKTAQSNPVFQISKGTSLGI